MGLSEQPETDRYDAFISYRRSDAAFARRLEKALRAYRPPAGFAGPQRYLRVFRDEGDLTGTDYYKSIDRHLRGSAKLIVVCSPAARASEYVDDEIRRFVASRGAEHIVPLLVAGVPNNEAGPAQLDQRAFPQALCDALEMPLAANYLGFDANRDRIDRGKYEGSWYTLLANLYDTSRDEIEQRDRMRRRRRRNLLGAIVGAVMIGFASLAAIAWWQKLAADEQRNTALRGLAKYLAAESEDARSARPQTGLLLAVEAVRTTRDVDGSVTRAAEAALRGALAAASGRPLGAHAGGVESAAFSADGARVATFGRDGKARVWNLHALDLPPRAIDVSPGTPAAMSVSGDGKWLALATREAGDLVLSRIDAPDEPPLRLDPPVEGLRALAFSPDSRWLVGGGSDAVLRLWRLDDPRAAPVALPGHAPTRDFQGRPQGVLHASFDPQGRWLASTAWDGVLIRDLNDPQAPPQRLKSGFQLNSPHFSRDGRWLALTLSGDAQIPGERLGLWRLAGQRWEAVAPGDEPTSGAPRIGGGDLVVGFHPERPWLVTVDPDGVRVRDLDAGPAVVRAVPGYVAAMSPDGTRLATAARDDTADGPRHVVRVWNLLAADDAPATIMTLDAPALHLGFGLQGRQLSIVAEDGRLWLSALDAEEPVNVPLRGQEARTDRALFSPDGRWLLALPKWGEHSVRLWRVDNPSSDPVIVQGVPATPELAYRTRDGGGGGEPIGGLPAALAIDSAGKWLAVPGLGRTARVVNLEDPGETPRVLAGHGHEVTAIAFGPRAGWLATADWNHAVRLWRFPDLAEPFARLEAPDSGVASSVSATAVSPDGARIATGGSSGEVALWNTGGADAAPRILGGHRGWITALDFSPDGKRLLSAGEDGRVQLWNLDPARPEPFAFDAHGDAVSGAAFAQGGRLIATVGIDALIRIWTADDPGASPLTLRGHAERISSMSLDLAGRWLVTGSLDGTARLLDLEAPDRPAALLGPPQAPINVVSISPDARWIAAADTRGDIRVWSRTDPGGAPAVLRDPAPDRGSAERRGKLWALRFSPDGRWLVALAGGQARLWRMRLDEEMQLACEIAGRNLSLDTWDRHLEGIPYRLSCAEHGLHPDFLASVDRLAELGEIDRAERLYRRAGELGAAIAPEPRARAVERAVAAGLKEGRRLARDGQTEAALAELGRVAAIDPARALDPAALVERVVGAQALVSDAERQARSGSLEPAVELFGRARALDPDLDLEPEREARRLYAPAIEKAADALAAQGRIDEAIAEYERALAYGLPSDLSPPERARNLRAHAIVAQAREIGRAGDLAGAIARFEQALALEPRLRLDPAAEARKLVAEHRIESADRLAREDRIAEAVSAYAEAFALDPDARFFAGDLNELCWRGVQQGLAARVIALCDRVVGADPDNGGYRDSRGVARVLTGDIAGAIEDFAAFVEWAPANRFDTDLADSRRRWIAKLKGGARVRSFNELEALGAKR